MTKCTSAMKSSRYRCLLIFIAISLVLYLIYQRIIVKQTKIFKIPDEIFSVINPRQCKWPPDYEYVQENRNISYNITVCVQLKSDSGAHEDAKRYPISHLFNVLEGGRTVTFEDLASLPRNIYRSVRYPDIYDTYPQDVPIKSIVERIKKGLPVSYRPKYNFPINILKTSKSVCSESTKHDFILVVKSAVYNIDERKEFREFMRNQSARCSKLIPGLIFSVGIARDHGGRVFNRDGYAVNLNSSSGDKLQQYEGKADELLKEVFSESEIYDDILLADYVDTYYNLSWKTVTNLRWISAFCNKNHSDFFMFIDDDFRVDLELLNKFRKGKFVKDLRSSIWGKIASADEANRPMKTRWFLTYRELPWNTVSPYPRGMSQIIGADIIDDMAIASAYTKHNYMNEDIYLGLLARKLGIPLRHVENMYDRENYWPKPPKQPPLVTMKEKFK